MLAGFDGRIPLALKPRTAFFIELTDDADEHLASLTARDRATLLDAVEEQLTHQPTLETTNRKRLRANPIAPWVLRVAHLRVYYEVRLKPPVVTVRAIGIKDRERVRIGGQEVDLT